jgi:hypothetical protein
MLSFRIGFIFDTISGAPCISTDALRTDRAIVLQYGGESEQEDSLT